MLSANSAMFCFVLQSMCISMGVCVSVLTLMRVIHETVINVVLHAVCQREFPMEFR